MTAETDKQFVERVALVFEHEGYVADIDWPILFALARRGAEMQWRPIEEAPKDGAQFLALLSNGWYALLRAPTGLKEGWPFQWWKGSQSPPIVETHPAGTDWNETHTILATQWMPLPPPPTGEKE